MTEGVTQLGVDQLVDPLAHMTEERGVRLRLVHQQDPGEVRALSGIVLWEVESDERVRTVCPQARPDDEPWTDGLHDVRTLLVGSQREPLPGAIAVRLDKRVMHRPRRCRLVAAAPSYLDHGRTVGRRGSTRRA